MSRITMMRLNLIIFKLCVDSFKINYDSCIGLIVTDADYTYSLFLDNINCSKSHLLTILIFRNIQTQIIFIIFSLYLIEYYTFLVERFFSYRG